MRNSKGVVADFACLFAEDRAEQSFLGVELCFALRGYLTNKDIAGMDFRTDTNDTALVEILQSVF